MPTARNAVTEALTVMRVGESVWVLRPTGALRDRLVDALRDAFLEVVDSGAETVVIDLNEVVAISVEAASTLVAMADLMQGRAGALRLVDRDLERRPASRGALEPNLRLGPGGDGRGPAGQPPTGFANLDTALMQRARIHAWGSDTGSTVVCSDDPSARGRARPI
jgi:anti-anti-sigma regulatory factor